MSQANNNEWVTVGHRSDMVPGAGVGALVNGVQVALFWVPELDDGVFAVSNFCPFSDVHIIARGIVGDVAGEPVVATPLYKQHFSLLDGHCIEQPEVRLDCYAVRINGDDIQVAGRLAKALAA
ncbi:MAG: nitrite reductase small subunit NirD [Natronospirillum sp.]